MRQIGFSIFNRPVQSSLDSALTASQYYYKLNWVQKLLVNTPDVTSYSNTCRDVGVACAEEASIQMKADSEHDVHRCAFTLFVNCQFLALITVCNCQAGLVFWLSFSHSETGTPLLRQHEQLQLH